MLKLSGRKEFVSCMEGLGNSNRGGEGLNWAKWSSELQEWPFAGPAEGHTHEWMWGGESPLVRICSTFLWNWHISFHLFPYQVEPGSIMLKMETLYSSEFQSKPVLPGLKPQNSHHLNHKHVKSVFLRTEINAMSVNVIIVTANCCLYKSWRHMCEC
jgi:hypothetical protein